VRCARQLKGIGKALRDAGATGCLAMIISSLALPLSAADKTTAKPSPESVETQQAWTTPLGQDEKILQLLNRITFGPRPGDVERVKQMGLKKFVDEQLHPERIDDSAVEAKIAALPTLSMSSEELAEDFQAMRAERRAQKGELVGQKPEQASFFDGLKSPKPGVRQDDSEARSASPSAAAGDAMTMSASGTTAQSPAAMRSSGIPLPRRLIMELAQEEVLRAVYSDRQLQEVMVRFWMNHFNIFVPKGADRWLTNSFERDAIRPHSLGKFEDLFEATAKSPAMLFYLDNWLSATPNPVYPNQPAPGQRPLRGPFGGRRYGVWRPSGPPPGQPARTASGSPAVRPANPNAKRAKRGLNENYARELMELHTLGVDGGYTQQDVIEVARCLTGWTIDRPGQGGGFIFRPRMHDFGAKVVLGHKIPAGRGIEDGLEVLHLLAHQPATAHFIALKLCRRFVADDPPSSVVDRAAQTFLAKDGDLRAVLKTILTSPEFYSEAAYRAKVKSPMELVASTIRALGATTDAGVPLVQYIAQMGQPLFLYQAPSGFPDRASTWINSSALLMRMNFAVMLAANRIAGTQVDFSSLDASSNASPDGTSSDETSVEASASVDRVMDRLAAHLFHGMLSAKTRQTILREMASGGEVAGGAGAFSGNGGGSPKSSTAQVERAMAALLIASPDFQRR
jgi:uncharacterized protein (DUF1800 family)